MDVIAYVIMLALGIVLTFFSIVAKSKYIGIFGGLFLLLVGLAGIGSGLQQPMLSVTVNETGDLTTQTINTDIISSADFLNAAYFNLPILGFGLFIFLFNVVAEIDEKRGKG